MKIDIEKILKDLEKHLDDSSNSTQVIENKNKWFKANITPLNMQIKNIPNDEKADYGKQLKILNDSVNKTFEKKLNEISEIEEQKNHVVNYDININTADLRKGALNPITIIYHALIEYFEKMNFDISFGEEITTTKYGFDSLNVPITHPTRQTSETFYLNDTNTIIMRQQNTEGTARALANAAIKYKKHPEEVRVVTCGKTYRNDDDDAVHSHQFHQLDFVWAKKGGLSVKNLKWIINGFIHTVFGEDVNSRFRLSNFGFTEPSFEVDVQCPFCNGKGCSKCKKSGWIELGGAGILHKNVIKAAGLNENEFGGIAYGLGIDRIAMIKFGIEDIRDIYSADSKFMRQFANEELRK